MLFGDVAGFSGLPESHLPAFFIQFLAVVEQQSKQRGRCFRTPGATVLSVFPT